MGVRIIVAIDTDQDEMVEAYRAVYRALGRMELETVLQWESTDEWYSDSGESYDPSEIQEARMLVFAQEQGREETDETERS